MAFEEIKENLSEAEISMRSYLETNAEYYKLKGFKFLMKAITSFSKILLIGLLGMLALLFLSLAASYSLGELLESTAYGFLVVGAIYVLMGLLIYAFRHRLDGPLLRKFSEYYFDEL